MILPIGSNIRLAQGSRLKVLGTDLQPPALSLQPRAGLTLVEVLVSVVLIAVGTVVVMQALANVAHAQLVAEDRAQAYLGAASKMAEVELAVAGGTPLPEETGGQGRLHEQPFEWSVSAVAHADDPEVRTVTFAVRWNRGRDTYRQEVSTLVRVPQESP